MMKLDQPQRGHRRIWGIGAHPRFTVTVACREFRTSSVARRMIVQESPEEAQQGPQWSLRLLKRMLPDAAAPQDLEQLISGLVSERVSE